MAIVVAGLLASASVVGAEVVTIDDPATADSTAERIVRPIVGPIFPLNMQPTEAVPDPMCALVKGFGDSASVSPGGHQGLDIGARRGQEVYAVEDGQLVTIERVDGGSAGIQVRLQTATRQYRYYHLDSIPAALAVGDTVQQGYVIGYVGDTGNATPGGYHLHFEVRVLEGRSSTPIDPLPILTPVMPPACEDYL